MSRPAGTGRVAAQIGRPLAGPPCAAGAASGRTRAFSTLKWTSFAHSCVYLALLLCGFALGKPEPATFALGLTHGLLWIAMSLACITATRLRVVPLRLAVAVAVLGGIGPFFGSAEFVREQRRRSEQFSRSERRRRTVSEHEPR